MKKITKINEEARKRKEMVDSGSDSGWVHFQCLPADFLAKAVNGAIDLNAWAAMELASRGQDKAGKWIGFKTAKKFYKIEK